MEPPDKVVGGESSATGNAAEAAVTPSTTSPKSAAAVQDSPVFSYINNLSPIEQPVRGASVVQGFPGLNSPPLVFASPRISARQSLDFKRSQSPLGKNITIEKSTSRVGDELNQHIKEENGKNECMHEKEGSPSGCIDDYLADTAEIGGEDSTQATDASLKQLGDVPPKMGDSIIHSEKDDKTTSVVASGASSDHQGNFSDAKPDGNDDKGGSSGIPSNVFEKTASDFTSVQQSQQLVTERVWKDKDSGKKVGAGVANEATAGMVLQDSKVVQSQLGKRRRLQFEEAQKKIVTNSPSSRSPMHSPNSEALDSSLADIPSTPCNVQLGGFQSTCPSSSSEDNRNASLTVPRPLGIGLHLNSIVNARASPCFPNLSVKSTDGSLLSAGGENSIYRSPFARDDMKYHSISPNLNLIENASAGSEEYAHQNPASCLSYNIVKPLKMTEHQETSDQQNLNSEQTERVDEIDITNPKRKRKKAESTGDGCKRCNCKKTKCLKLYCDCFAAGIYCAEPCACQGCFNRPEYEDTVLETRQQIESRNPLAFAPKIVQRVTQPPIIHSVEDKDQLPPLAGRHKRGCNCKKSMCLKKYCECYQANVGCSDGCRCEGCQNIYGKKEEYGMSREMGINEKLDDSFDGKLKMVPVRPSFSLTDLHNPQNLTPQTPSFQHSNHGRDPSKSRLFAGRYIPSPESDCTFYPPYPSTPLSPRDAANHGMILQTSAENFDTVPFGQQSYPNVEFMDEFSPGCHTSSNTSHLTSLTNLPLPMRDWSNSSRAPLLPGSGSFSSLGSLRWRGSPVTPVTLFGGTQATNIKENPVDVIDDDTQDMLKDSSGQLTTVKVSSPNKKRVSPREFRQNEPGSGPLQSGRKFILKAVSSFPPLTPCIDSKDTTTVQNINDPAGDIDS